MGQRFLALKGDVPELAEPDLAKGGAMEQESRLDCAEAGQGAERGSDEDSLFSIESLRISQDFSADLGVKKALLTVPVRKPHKQEFIRVRPGGNHRLETTVLELKPENETYLVSPELRPALMAEIVPKVLLTAISRQDVLFLWPVRLPDADGRIDSWNESALKVSRTAENEWVRLSANRPLGAYDAFVAQGNLPDPEWPDKSFNDLLELAFKERYIQDVDHPVIRALRGEN